MAQSYRPYNDLNEIYKRKQIWADADSKGDDARKKKAAEEAKKYYRSLAGNGYGGLSEEMRGAGLRQAKKLADYYGMEGKHPVREYLYTKGKSMGLSKSDIDGLLKYNGVTGEISFGGKNIGKPDSVVDGVSYMEDSAALDSSFDDYIKRAGVTRSKADAVKGENEKLFNMYEREYNDLKDTNPFETDEAKAILGKYDLAALYGRDNALAKEAGSNGGNIDSFAAANALKQQAALIADGQMAVLSGYQQKVEHARKLLSDMGVNIGRVAAEDETERNGDVKRKTEIAAVTGKTPDEWTASLNPYMNEDGTLKEEYKNLDFAAIMQNAKESGNSEAYKNAALARFYKIMGDYERFGKYDDGNYTVPEGQITEDARQFNEQIAQADRALGAEKEINSDNNQNKLDVIRLEGEYKNTGKPKITAEQASKAVKNGELTREVIDAYNYYFGTSYTVENPPGKSGLGSVGAPVSDKNVRAWVNYLNSDISKRYGKDKRALVERGENKYVRADADASYIVNKVYDATELTEEQKNYLLYDKFGLTEDEVRAALGDRRGNNAK